jgi:hypothetical protein
LHQPGLQVRPLAEWRVSLIDDHRAAPAHWWPDLGADRIDQAAREDEHDRVEQTDQSHQKERPLHSFIISGVASLLN